MTRAPVLFVGHGSPMNAITDNRWSRGFASLTEALPTPTAVLAISAHWYIDGTWVLASAQPRTIHDFGGFPQALFEVQYPAPGTPDVAARVRTLLADHAPTLDETWGLDHGTWSVLRWMYPEANVPVLQLSIDRRLSHPQHLEIGRALAPLRDEGVLIVGSGNITHNLRHAMGQMRAPQPEQPAWARTFDVDVARAVQQHDGRALAAVWPDGDHARLAHPTPDHYIPLLYAQGASSTDDVVTFPIEGFDLGSLSMRAIRWG